MQRDVAKPPAGWAFQMGSKPEHSAARIGLIAGWGRYPLVVAEALNRAGYRVSCLAIKDHADSALRDLCDHVQPVGLAKLGQAIRYFRRRGVSDAVMAGKVHKVRLYQPWMWIKHLPDWTCLKTFYPHFIATNKDRKDDTLLGAIVEAFHRGGITLGPATDYAPELLVKHGCLTTRFPSSSQQADITFGWTLAKEMGRLDVGQSVAVRDRAALAIEAIEGTDECIRRAGVLCRAGEFTIVKVAKPQQDMRFDVPTIGLGTLETMRAAGARVLAVEAARTIIIDEPQVVAYANAHKLSIVALDAQGRMAG